MIASLQRFQSTNRLWYQGSVSRSAKRVRLRLAVTAQVAGNGARGRAFVCRTRDVSNTGVLLETPETLEPGLVLELNLLDPETGESVELRGQVMRHTPPADGRSAMVGVHLDAPAAPWTRLVARAQARVRDTLTVDRPARRLRVLVVSDDDARRGAVALYVTSGWDVRFASDIAGAEEALRGLKIDAVIAEHDLNGSRWAPVLEAAQRAQPGARRIVRSSLHGQATPPPGGPDDLVHRVVDLNAGLEAVFDALTADWGRA
jgi:hypothetical protein